MPNKNRKSAKSGTKNARRSGSDGASASRLQDRQRTLQIVRSPGLLVPRETKVTFRFQQRSTMTVGATTYIQDYFSMNSPYDALFTVGGGTCSGFANWMALYQRFYVTKATIQMQVLAVTVADGTDMGFVYPLRSDEMAGGIVPSFDRFFEGGRGTSTSITASPFQNCMVMRDTQVPVQFQGIPAASNREEMSGSAAADPQIQPGWAVGFCGTNTHSFVVQVVVEYFTTLWAPLSQANA